MSKILIAYSTSEVVRKMLSEVGELVEVKDRADFLEKAADADAIYGNMGMTIDREVLDRAKKLKVVGLVSVGYNNLDLEGMHRRGIIGTNTPGVLNDSVADLAIGLMVGCARRMGELDRYMREGRWTKSSGKAIFGLEVSGKTLGIIGMGRIGYDIAMRAHLGMHMDILYYNRHHNEKAEQELGASYVSKEELMRRSDFVVLVTPLTDQTRGLIGEKELSLMKPTGILINVGRGPVVDEKALVAALKERKIYAAGLDVYDQEPIDPSNPLLQLENVFLVPHIGTATEEMREKMSILAAKNVVAVLKGEKPLTPVPELADLV